MQQNSPGRSPAEPGLVLASLTGHARLNRPTLLSKNTPKVFVPQMGDAIEWFWALARVVGIRCRRAHWGILGPGATDFPRAIPPSANSRAGAADNGCGVRAT